MEFSESLHELLIDAPLSSNVSDTNSSSLKWTTIQPILFDDAHADVLILLDCCYAGCARFRAVSTGRGTKEILAACSNRLPTTGVEYRSFTSVLADELKSAAAENQLRGDSLSVVELHSYMHDNRKLQYQPIYAQVNRNRYHTISLIPFPSLPSNSAGGSSPHDLESWSVVSDGRSRSSNNPTRVLLAIHTSRSPTKDLVCFLKNECMLPSYVTGMKIEEVINIESIYESESTLALISVPLSIWNLLPDHPACRYIGKIRTGNLCQQTSVQDLFAQVRKPTVSHIVTDDDFGRGNLPSQLTDLKQRQANVSEAPTVGYQIETSARHGRYILLFTVFTIIFLPISVITTILGMNLEQLNPGSKLKLWLASLLLFHPSLLIAVMALVLAVGCKAIYRWTLNVASLDERA